MKTKNKTVSRIVSFLLVLILTSSFLFFTENSQLFDFFNTEQKVYITLFIGLGVLLIIVGVFLLFKTIKQYRTNHEILKTKHADLGVYNKGRNPFYASIFLISSGDGRLFSIFSKDPLVSKWCLLRHGKRGCFLLLRCFSRALWTAHCLRQYLILCLWQRHARLLPSHTSE